MHTVPIRTGLKLALGAYAGIRVLDLCMGGKWNGREREVQTFFRTLPTLVHAFDRMMEAVHEVSSTLTPTLTQVTARQQVRRKRGSQALALRKKKTSGTKVVPTRHQR